MNGVLDGIAKILRLLCNPGVYWTTTLVVCCEVCLSYVSLVSYLCTVGLHDLAHLGWLRNPIFYKFVCFLHPVSFYFCHVELINAKTNRPHTQGFPPNVDDPNKNCWQNCWFVMFTCLPVHPYFLRVLLWKLFYGIPISSAFTV